MRRAPAPLSQQDKYDCVVCVVTNLLYMFYLLESPDTSLVSKKLNRRDGDIHLNEPSSLVLLNQGLSVYIISEFDNSTYIHHGISYLRHFYQAIWNEGWDELNTPDAVALGQARINKIETEVAGKNLPRYLDHRKPTLDDIVHLVRAGFVIDLATRYKSQAMSHAMLVYDVNTDGTYFSVYNPAPDGITTLYDMSAEELLEQWDGYWLSAWWRER